MGESVAEATLISWLKDVGENIDADESIVEIATDKVDSDVPSEFAGKLIEKRFEKDDVIKVGEVIAVIESDQIPNIKAEEEITSRDSNVPYVDYKDKKKNALNFLELYGDPFDQIFIDKQGTISINFGAYGVPETFLVNEDKKVLKKYIGPLNDEDVNEIKNITDN